MKILNLLIFAMSISLSAQIAIGKENVEGSGILDFGFGQNKGIILPAVTATSQTPVNGTILFDQNDKKIKILENKIWLELSKSGSTEDLLISDEKESGEGVILGAESSAVSGVLVLESSNQALILPKIADPEINVKSPYPGMICYDITSKSLAVFDGIAWNYWK